MPMGAYVERGGVTSRGVFLGGYFWEGKQVFWGGWGLLLKVYSMYCTWLKAVASKNNSKEMFHFQIFASKIMLTHILTNFATYLNNFPNNVLF